MSTQPNHKDLSHHYSFKDSKQHRSHTNNLLPSLEDLTKDRSL